MCFVEVFWAKILVQDLISRSAGEKWVPLLLCAKIRIHDEARRGGGKDPTTTTCLLCAFSVCATNATTVSAVFYGSACVSYLHAMDPYLCSFEESRRRGRWWWCVVCPPFLPFSSTSLSNYACFFLVRFSWPLLFSSLWGFAGWFWVSSFLDELFCLRSQFFCFIWSQLSASACPICFSFFVWEGLLWVLARRDKNNWRFLRKGRMWNMCKSYYNISAIRMCRSWFCGNSFGWCNYETMRKEFIHKKIPCCIEDESGIVWTSPSKGTRL